MCCILLLFIQSCLLQVVGRLAARRPSGQRPLRGLLVRTGHQDLVVHPDDLPLYTKLQPGRIVQRQHIVLRRPFAEVGAPAGVQCGHAGTSKQSAASTLCCTCCTGDPLCCRAPHRAAQVPNRFLGAAAVTMQHAAARSVLLALS